MCMDTRGWKDLHDCLEAGMETMLTRKKVRGKTTARQSVKNIKTLNLF